VSAVSGGISALASKGIEDWSVKNFGRDYTIANGLNTQGTLNQAISSASGGLAGAATHSLIEGSDFGDNVLAALPDIVGQSIAAASTTARLEEDRTRQAELLKALYPDQLTEIIQSILDLLV
jgi:hypothetical protein